MPIFVMPEALDMFRLPKEALLRFEALALIVCALLGLLYSKRKITWSTWSEPPVLLAELIVAWALITTLTSTQVHLSAWSLLHVTAAAVVFIATYFVGHSFRLGTIVLFLIPAVANGILYSLQEHGIWNPFTFPERIPRHLQSSGLIGNPNDLGGYLVAPAIAALALALVTPNVRILVGSGAALLGLMVVLTQTLTATAAYLSGAIVLLLLASRRKVVNTIVVLTTVAAAVLVYPPMRQRVVTKSSELVRHDWDNLLSNRALAFLSAIDMLRDHPLVGVGPGCYGWNFYDYKLKVLARHPRLLDSATRPLNFAETHSDHFQTLAVSGVPGYLLFLGVLVTLGRISLQLKTNHQVSGARSFPGRVEFARLAALPSATAFGVLALAQFPLELAAPLHSFLSLAALCYAWSEVSA